MPLFLPIQDISDILYINILTQIYFYLYLISLIFITFLSMLQRYYFRISMITILFVSCFFYTFELFAAGPIARNDLRIELMLSTGTLDSGWLNRLVTITGSSQSFQPDTVYGVNSMKFNGSWWLKVNTGWATTTTTDNSTVSFWMKHSNSSFITSSIMLTGSTITSQYQFPNVGWLTMNTDTYTSNIGQDIFTTGDSNIAKFAISAWWKCSFRGAKWTFIQYQLINYYAATAVQTLNILESWNNFQENFNCSALLDGKWHNVVLLSKNGFTSVYIDGNEVVKFSGNTSIGRYMNIGYSDTDTLSYSGKFTPIQINTIRDSKFYRGNLLAFRLYSRALDTAELEALFDEYRYSQSSLVWAGWVVVAMEKYTKPNLYTLFSNIPTNLSKNLVTYEYSTNGTTYMPITDITDISTSTWSLKYRVWVDLSGVPDGLVTVSYRVRAANNAFQSIWTVSYTKIDLAIGIAINMPGTEVATSKVITADAPGTTLSMYITTSSICDMSIGATLFESYSDLVFTNKSDNGKRVCYKAVYPTINKTVYRISGAISGIQSDTSLKFFDDYLNWQKSTQQKPLDSTYMLLSLLWVSAASSQGTINGMTMTDINGDGLVDFLYSRNDPVRSAIVVNNGNYTFKSVYKCALDAWPVYYGDCADMTR